MTIASDLPLAELTTVTLRLLIQEIGVVNTARFLSQYTTGWGDSVAEKDNLLGTMTVMEIVTAIRATPPSPPSS